MNEVFASVDLGGTSIKAGLADATGKVLVAGSQPTLSQRGPESILKSIADLVGGLAQKSGHRPSALGMGVPGLIDLKHGVVKFLPNFPGHWRDVPARDILAGAVGCDVFLLNDVRTATLGELVFGGGRGVGTMVFFAVGTGIGGGVVVDGKLRLGPLGAAGELGHMTVQPDGPLCGCGNHGCLEALASGPALTGEGVRLLRSGQTPKLYELTGGDASKVTPQTMAQAAGAGDEDVLDAIRRAGEMLGIGVANVITVLHPDLVVIGGGVADMGDLLLEPVRQTVRRRVRMFPADSVRIEASQLGDQAGMLGGVALAMMRGRVEQ
jgi:glucokinase